MALPMILEGSWDEIAAHAEELRVYKNLRLTVPVEDIQEEHQAALHEKFAAIIAVAERMESEPGSALIDPHNAKYEASLWMTALPQERADDFERWTSSHAQGAGLPDEALRRENIYEDR